MTLECEVVHDGQEDDGSSQGIESLEGRLIFFPLVGGTDARVQELLKLNVPLQADARSSVSA